MGNSPAASPFQPSAFIIELPLSKGRAVISCLAVKRAGYTQKQVCDSLHVSRIAVRNSLEKGEKAFDMCQEILEKVT